MATEEPKSKAGSRVVLIALGVIALFVAARLVTRWLKWLVILVALAGLAYALIGQSGGSKGDDEGERHG